MNKSLVELRDLAGVMVKVESVNSVFVRDVVLCQDRSLFAINITDSPLVTSASLLRPSTLMKQFKAHHGIQLMVQLSFRY